MVNLRDLRARRDSDDWVQQTVTIPAFGNDSVALMIFSRPFYDRSTLQVARDLIGSRLIRILDGAKLVGLITETEGYIGETDLACHAKAGRTPRTAVMYGDPGHAYVYFTYGNHWMFNIVTEREGVPAAVLIRAIQPVEEIARIRQRRKGRDTFGPGKLCQALGIDKRDNGVDVTQTTGGLWIEAGVNVPDSLVLKGPRIGLNKTPEPWLSKPWRFLVKDHAISSRLLTRQSIAPLSGPEVDPTNRST